ncbi:MAG TPA: dihydroxyacetone kinase subunit L [Firmicutes bacterium]|jgi:dihydroxyacetone kinase-like protein|nr:dihydroxyacetone kinase subunit L [Bacillota bacterium]
MITYSCSDITITHQLGESKAEVLTRTGGYFNMDSISAAQAREMMVYVADAIVESKELLCEADRNIGDGDHGIGMAAGLDRCREELRAREFTDVYDVFSTSGRTMIRTMGGASGIIFGMLFYAGSRNMPPQSEIGVSEFSCMFEKALAEIQAKGHAEVGDKTVVDALHPMVVSLRHSSESALPFKEALRRAYLAAEEGKEASKHYVAKFGKAKTLGERAIGFPDAGAVSLSLIAKAMSDWAEMVQHG